jgi:serine/threonine protein kinase
MMEQHICPHCQAINEPGTLYCTTCNELLDVADVNTGSLHGFQLLPPGHVLRARYTINSLLGQGGMGAVYKIQDEQFNGRMLALKELVPNQLSTQKLSHAVAQFQTEAQLLASLTHPHLPRIYDSFTEDERWYLVMDYIEGQTLEQYVSTMPAGRLSLDATLAIGIQLASVLNYLHTRPTPIVFRDLKPLNVMITPDNDVFLIDFGIARIFKPSQAQDTDTYATLGYAAPEQYSMHQTTPRTDIYSLGVLLHRMLSGYEPKQSIIPYALEPLQEYLPQIPPDLSQLVARMTALAPEERPASMAEVKTALEHITLSVHPVAAIPTLLTAPTSAPIQQPIVISPFPAQSTSLAYQETLETAPNAPLPPHTSFPDQSANTDTPSIHAAPGDTPPVPHHTPISKHAFPLSPKRSISRTTLLASIVLIAFLALGAWFAGSRITASYLTHHAQPSSVAHTTPSRTAAVVPTITTNTIAYPSQSQAKAAISYYYTHESSFKGKNIIQKFKSLVFGPYSGPKNQPQFFACAQYTFAYVSSPTVTRDIARHTFTFNYKGNRWSVTNMGNWNSC